MHRRATAFAIYGLGISIGMALGLMVGGYASARFGWRIAFMLVGLPGLLLALLVRFTLREPQRGQQERIGVDTRRYSIAQTVRLLRSRKSFLSYAIGIGVCSFSGNAFETWTPVYLMRFYHMDAGTVGAWSGSIEGIGGIIGTLSGGLLADHLGRRDMRWYLWLPALTAGAMIPSMYIFLHTSQTRMFVFYFLTVVFAGSYMAPIIAITQRIMPVDLRALATALVYLLLNLIGPGAGPFVAGILSDALSGTFGAEAIRMALTITLTAAAGGVALMLHAAHRLPGDLVTDSHRDGSEALA